MIVLLFIALLRDFGLVHLPVPSTGTQVPPGLRDAYPAALWVPIFGLILGFTFLTRVSVMTHLLFLLTVGFLATSPLQAVSVGAVYGLTRLLRVVVDGTRAVRIRGSGRVLILTATMMAMAGAVFTFF
jgi:hypothetical protein